VTSPVPPLILASTSPYRRELLTRLRLPFTIENPGIDELHQRGEEPAGRAARLALAKARAVAARAPLSTVIGSDQVAISGTQVLDKPGDAAHCREQLLLLSGNSAQFHTAVAVVSPSLQAEDCFSDVTTVRFRRLTEAEIERYIAAEQPFDCAGGFRSEALGIALFERLESVDPTGLVGLPLIRLATSLRRLGYALP